MFPIILLALIGLIVVFSIFSKLFNHKTNHVRLPNEPDHVQLDKTISTTTAVTQEKRVKRLNDSNLRRVSISTNNILFNDKFETHEAMANLLPALSNKYRIFLITQVPSEKSIEYMKAQAIT